MSDVMALDIPLKEVAALMYVAYIKGKFQSQNRKPVGFEKLGASEQAGWLMAARCGCDVVAGKIQEHMGKLHAAQMEGGSPVQ